MAVRWSCNSSLVKIWLKLATNQLTRGWGLQMSPHDWQATSKRSQVSLLTWMSMLLDRAALLAL